MVTVLTSFILLLQAEAKYVDVCKAELDIESRMVIKNVEYGKGNVYTLVRWNTGNAISAYYGKLDAYPENDASIMFSGSLVIGKLGTLEDVCFVVDEKDPNKVKGLKVFIKESLSGPLTSRTAFLVAQYPTYFRPTFEDPNSVSIEYINIATKVNKIYKVKAQAFN